MPLSLPPELLLQILLHLSPVSRHTATPRRYLPWTSAHQHPFLALSLVSHALHDAVEGHCRHLLRLYTPGTTAAEEEEEEEGNARRRYIEYASEHCYFCAAPTRRGHVCSSPCWFCDRETCLKVTCCRGCDTW
ncbi:hypothetical protein BZA05DRAFT_60692 [Tricharina praecox]|uniref:uncharacterized protein n=1 Tax=Tricharina praecox TaxID=43433 RepID=UPI00221ECE56|nr:uncharacterized protein BZA05DRAFT_60692 [Tricharina praecox]KAI5850675.1 hypothetical protein BZA05DRAFT_60692 [Tricharina praecox]